MIHRSFFGRSLAVYGREEADPVRAARGAPGQESVQPMPQ
jgi:hypothetical protein